MTSAGAVAAAAVFSMGSSSGPITHSQEDIGQSEILCVNFSEGGNHLVTNQFGKPSEIVIKCRVYEGEKCPWKDCGRRNSMEDIWEIDKLPRFVSDQTGNLVTNQFGKPEIVIECHAYEMKVCHACGRRSSHDGQILFFVCQVINKLIKFKSKFNQRYKNNLLKNH